MKSKWFQKLGGGKMESFGLRTWSKLQFVSLRSRKDPKTMKLLQQIHDDRRSLMSAFETFLVYSIAKAQSNRPGDFAEVGVFKGASAKLMCEAKGDKVLRLFDTYEGLPPQSDKDPGVHREHQYACSLESVQKYLKGYPNLEYYKGIFPDSAKGVKEAQYAFAHFDVDLYEGTLGCLEYFYPRMIPGGIMLSHDYGMLAGVEKAFTEFFADKPEQVIEQPTTQCMVVKL
ncbi:MAG: TylF/MycF/NovP-related O-methyltransferase [Pirellulales bacterium]